MNEVIKAMLNTLLVYKIEIMLVKEGDDIIEGHIMYHDDIFVFDLRGIKPFDETSAYFHTITAALLFAVDNNAVVEREEAI